MSTPRNLTRSCHTLLATLVLLLAAAEVAAATYYLDAVSGNDVNSGTSAEPWLTLARAMSSYAGEGDTVTSGDTVVVRDGAYGAFTDSGSNEHNDWIVYIADSGHEPVFAYISLGGIGVSDFDLYYEFDGITVTPGNQHGTYGYYRAVTLRNVNYVRFKNMDIVGPGYAGTDDSAAFHLYTATNVLIDGCSVYGTEVGSRSAYMRGVYSRFSHDITVNECEITGCQHGVTIWGQRWTVSDNHLYGLDSDGILVEGACDTVISGNRIHDVEVPEGSAYHTDGIQMYYTATGSANNPLAAEHVFMDNILVSGNTIYNIGRQGIIISFGAYTGDPPKATNITIENNLIYDVDLEETGSYAFLSRHNSGQIFRHNTIVGKSVNWRTGSEVSIVSGNLLELGKFWSEEGVSEPSEYIGGNIVWDWWGINKGATDIKTRSDWSDTDKSLFFAMFSDHAGRDYSLVAEAAAIDYASLEMAPSNDLLGYERFRTADTGCYQYVSVGSVGRWLSDEYSAARVPNRARRNQPAVLTDGIPWHAKGQPILNGLSDFINCGTDANLNITGDLTIAAWIYPEHFGASDNARIIDKGAAPAGFSFSLNGPNRGLAYRAGADEARSNSDVITVNQWQHVAVSYSDASDTITFYVNGQPAGTVSNYQTNPTDSASAPLIIGNSASLTRGFKGMLTDVRIYSRALAADEIKAIYETWEVKENKLVRFDFPAADTDGAPLEFDFQDPATAPAGAYCEGNVFTWRPWYNQSGSYEITFEALNQPGFIHRVPIVVENVALQSWYRYWLQFIRKY